MVSPSTFTTDWPLAAERSTVGRRIATDTEPPKVDWLGRIISIQDNHRFFEDVAVHDAVRPSRGHFMPETDQDVVPGRVRRLSYVGRRGPRIGVGMRVKAPDDRQPAGFSLTVDPQVIPRIDGVDLCRGGGVSGRMNGGDSAVLSPYEQAAALFRRTHDAVGDH